MPFDRELQEALTAARLAGEYILREYQSFARIPDAPADISTHVDRGSQEIILTHLRAAFPADGLCAEEATDTLRTAPANADRVWVVDPIDGTRGFATKNGQFSVMIGLTVGGRPAVGVVLEPVVGRLTWATVGGGCWVSVGGGEAARCQVSANADPAALVLAQSLSRPGKPKFGARVLQPARLVETHSAGIKLALVARGEADVYVNDYPNFNDWDVCAGHVLVEEAGGRVTCFAGRPIGYGPGGPLRAGGLVATNGQVHDAVVARLSAG
ncbi:MAG: inositol monophosphatase family protein [Gemmataceae bacterium]